MATPMARPLLVTGGAGFIGSAFTRHALQEGIPILNLDKLTYAASRDALEELERHPLHRFVEGDIQDSPLLNRIFETYRPAGVIHFAAETHVDRSIDGPAAFIQTNIVGTQTLLSAALKYYQDLNISAQASFKLLHVSTDEVFGSLGSEGRFDENTPYDPRSPYSASKAASDHLVSAWFHTYGLPTIITNCTNNYGPYQFPEKLIPLMALRAMRGQTLPIYGTGENIRDWLYVDDHARGLLAALRWGIPGERYGFGGDKELSNLQMVHTLCEALDTMAPRFDGAPHSESIRFVTDRPGHDFRYAMDSSKATRELGWAPTTPLSEGLEKTIAYYQQAQTQLMSASYKGERLGLKAAG